MYVETANTVETTHTTADIDKRKPPLHLQISSLLHFLNPLNNSGKEENHTGHERRRGSTQSNRSVHFDRSPAVHYTHSKEDYDRGGNTMVSDTDMATTRARWAATIRPPLLDDTDEDDCSMDLISEATTTSRRRSSIHNIA